MHKAKALLVQIYEEDGEGVLGFLEKAMIPILNLVIDGAPTN